MLLRVLGFLGVALARVGFAFWDAAVFVTGFFAVDRAAGFLAVVLRVTVLAGDFRVRLAVVLVAALVVRAVVVDVDFFRVFLDSGAFDLVVERAVGDDFLVAISSFSVISRWER